MLTNSPGESWKMKYTPQDCLRVFWALLKPGSAELVWDEEMSGRTNTVSDRSHCQIVWRHQIDQKCCQIARSDVQARNHWNKSIFRREFTLFGIFGTCLEAKMPMSHANGQKCSKRLPNGHALWGSFTNGLDPEPYNLTSPAPPPEKKVLPTKASCPPSPSAA